MAQARTAENADLDDRARLTCRSRDRATQQRGDAPAGQSHFVEGALR
ncbi:hypothetical protein ACFXDH_50045 [Streptomyces sp. NPDC059467]